MGRSSEGQMSDGKWQAHGKEVVTKTLAEYAAEAAGDGRGIACPDCGCQDLRVQNTRDGNGIIKRWRVCRNCGRRVVTQEKPVGGRQPNQSSPEALP